MRKKSSQEICVQCGAKAKKHCPDCGRLLCGRCGTKKLRVGLGQKPIIQNRLCRDCVQVRAINTTIGSGYIAYKIFQKIGEYFKSKT